MGYVSLTDIFFIFKIKLYKSSYLCDLLRSKIRESFIGCFHWCYKFKAQIYNKKTAPTILGQFFYYYIAKSPNCQIGKLSNRQII